MSNDSTEKVILERLLRKLMGLDPNHQGKVQVQIDWKGGTICGFIELNSTKAHDLSRLKSI